jgi:hypothetical protein
MGKGSLWLAEQSPYGADTGIKSMFSGSIPALVTPFKDGSIDEAAFRRLIDWQIEQAKHRR